MFRADILPPPVYPQPLLPYPTYNELLSQQYGPSLAHSERHLDLGVRPRYETQLQPNRSPPRHASPPRRDINARSLPRPTTSRKLDARRHDATRHADDPRRVRPRIQPLEFVTTTAKSNPTTLAWRPTQAEGDPSLVTPRPGPAPDQDTTCAATSSPSASPQPELTTTLNKQAAQGELQKLVDALGPPAEGNDAARCSSHNHSTTHGLESSASAPALEAPPTMRTAQPRHLRQNVPPATRLLHHTTINRTLHGFRDP